MEKLIPQFGPALALGKHNEDVIAHEFRYQGIPVTQTEGRNDFDLYLPDGRSVEIKLDLRSQATGSGAIEWPTIQRNAAFYIHTLTYARVFTLEQYRFFYMHGKLPSGGIGDLNYEGRLFRNLGREGIPLYQFIKNLKNQELTQFAA